VGIVDLLKAIGILGELVKAFAQVVAFFKMKYGSQWATKMIEMANLVNDGFATLQKPEATSEDIDDATEKLASSFNFMRK